MILSHIAAMAKNRVIGRDNRLPWHLPDELAYFFRVTRGHHVIMGRKNYEANGKALPNRTNIVITRQASFEAPGCVVVSNIEEAISYASGKGETEAFIVGGGQIYSYTLPMIHRIYLTIIDTEIEGDTWYPEVDLGQWRLLSERFHPVDRKHPYSFTFYVYEQS